MWLLFVLVCGGMGACRPWDPSPKDEHDITADEPSWLEDDVAMMQGFANIARGPLHEQYVLYYPSTVPRGEMTIRLDSAASWSGLDLVRVGITRYNSNTDKYALTLKLMQKGEDIDGRFRELRNRIRDIERQRRVHGQGVCPYAEAALRRTTPLEVDSDAETWAQYQSMRKKHKREAVLQPARRITDSAAASSTDAPTTRLILREAPKETNDFSETCKKHDDGGPAGYDASSSASPKPKKNQS